MKKIILSAMLLISILYSDNNIIVLNGEVDSDVAEMLIRGNGEECKVSIDSMGTLAGTTCLQITNSKGIKILCTSKKKICKTMSEVRNTLNTSSPRPDDSGLKSLRQGMNYSQVRKIILNAGWQTTRKRWQDVSEYGQVKDIYYNNGWQEVVDCAGTGTAPCRFEFKDINQRTLVVITEGECFNSKGEEAKENEICDLSVSQWFLE